MCKKNNVNENVNENENENVKNTLKNKINLQDFPQNPWFKSRTKPV